MREILFRGKRKEDGEWVEGYYAKVEHWLDDHEMHIIIPVYTTVYPHCEFTSYDEVDPETVGQFTGLLDKNGKKIFEGDILDFPRWVVTYCADVNESLGMNAGWYTQRDDFTSWAELENVSDHVVLGNVYDNPELLERYWL